MLTLSARFRCLLALVSLFALSAGCGTLQSLADGSSQGSIQAPPYPTGNQCYDSCTREYHDCMNDAANTVDDSQLPKEHRRCLSHHSVCAEDC